MSEPARNLFPVAWRIFDKENDEWWVTQIQRHADAAGSNAVALYAYGPELLTALTWVINAHDEYIEANPHAKNEPDPLFDACEAARVILNRVRA